jgi:hypothetical protein
MMSMMISRGSRKSAMETKCRYDEVMTLKTAIEEAIMKGQRSFGALGHIAESGMSSDEELDLIDLDEGSGVVGWVDDL